MLAECTIGSRPSVEGCVETAVRFQKYQMIVSVLGTEGGISQFRGVWCCTIHLLWNSDVHWYLTPLPDTFLEIELSSWPSQVLSLWKYLTLA